MLFAARCEAFYSAKVQSESKPGKSGKVEKNHDLTRKIKINFTR
jgi:hypothetical protein